MKIYVLGCDENSISDVGDAEGPGEAVTDGTDPFPAVTVWTVHCGAGKAMQKQQIDKPGQVVKNV